MDLVNNDVFGDDMEVEQLNPLLLAKPIRKDDKSGWQFRTVPMTADDLTAHPAVLAWEPVRLTDHEAILIDCPPSLGLLTVNALVAADRAILTAEAQYFALQGVEQAMEVVELARDGLNPQLSLLGVLLNRADMRTVHSREALASLRERFGEQVFDTVVRSSIAYAESAERATSILDHRPDLGEDYVVLADEVLGRLSGFAQARGQLARIGA